MKTDVVRKESERHAENFKLARMVRRIVLLGEKKKRAAITEVSNIMNVRRKRVAKYYEEYFPPYDPTKRGFPVQGCG